MPERNIKVPRYVKSSLGVRKGTNISRLIHKLVAKLYRQFTSMILLPIQISEKVYLFGQLDDHVLSCAIEFDRHCLAN